MHTRRNLHWQSAQIRLDTIVAYTHRCVRSSRMIVNNACSCRVGGNTRALSGRSTWFLLDFEAGMQVVWPADMLVGVVCS